MPKGKDSTIAARKEAMNKCQAGGMTAANREKVRGYRPPPRQKLQDKLAEGPRTQAESD